MVTEMDQNHNHNYHPEQEKVVHNRLAAVLTVILLKKNKQIIEK